MRGGQKLELTARFCFTTTPARTKPHAPVSVLSLMGLLYSITHPTCRISLVWLLAEPNCQITTPDRRFSQSQDLARSVWVIVGDIPFSECPQLWRNRYLGYAHDFVLSEVMTTLRDCENCLCFFLRINCWVILVKSYQLFLVHDFDATFPDIFNYKYILVDNTSSCQTFKRIPQNNYCIFTCKWWGLKLCIAHHKQWSVQIVHCVLKLITSQHFVGYDSINWKES